MSRPEFFEPLLLSIPPSLFTGSPASTLTNTEPEPVFEHDAAYDDIARLFECDYNVMHFAYEAVEADAWEEDDAWAADAPEAVYEDEEEDEASCHCCGYALVVGERNCCTDCRQQMSREERIWFL